MKIFSMICGTIGLVCWSLVCIGAAVGWIDIEVVDYCFVTGLLAFQSLIIAVWGGV